jgi:Transposase domain (DUF772)
MKQSGLFGLSDHLKRLSANGDPLEELVRIVDFEGFRPILDTALAYADGAKGGRPPYDPVAMFKILILAAQNNVADARMEYLIRDRLSWLRFLGFDLGAPTPDANKECISNSTNGIFSADANWQLPRYDHSEGNNCAHHKNAFRCDSWTSVTHI